jgi:hypothetical protein
MSNAPFPLGILCWGRPSRTQGEPCGNQVIAGPSFNPRALCYWWPLLLFINGLSSAQRAQCTLVLVICPDWDVSSPCSVGEIHTLCDGYIYPGVHTPLLLESRFFCIQPFFALLPFCLLCLAILLSNIHVQLGRWCTQICLCRWLQTHPLRDTFYKAANMLVANENTQKEKLSCEQQAAGPPPPHVQVTTNVVNWRCCSSVWEFMFSLGLST